VEVEGTGVGKYDKITDRPKGGLPQKKGVGNQKREKTIKGRNKKETRGAGQ